MSWLNVVPIQLRNGNWTLAEGKIKVLFALEYATKAEAWQAIAEEEAEEDEIYFPEPEQHGQHTD